LTSMPAKSTRSRGTPGPPSSATDETGAAATGSKGRSTRQSTRLGSATTEEDAGQQTGQTGFVMAKSQAAAAAPAGTRRSARQPLLPRPIENAEPIVEEVEEDEEQGKA
jgi:hypothetical protein